MDLATFINQPWKLRCHIVAQRRLDALPASSLSFSGSSRFRVGNFRP
jgi:hypothetical protein